MTGYGLYIAGNAKLDVFPEFVQPQVTVQAEAPGLAPEQVEALVTRPIESVLNGAGNLESIRSESIQGLSVVDAVFKEGTDGVIRVSLRSLGAVDVCRIAQSQGGGGHRFAAGFSTDDPVPEIVRRIESALRE